MKNRAQTKLFLPRQNQDRRIATAYNLLNAYPEGEYLVHKTTRAGCTTALVAESMNRHERFLVVVPTIRIADKTVIEDSIKYSDREVCDVIRIPSNHACRKNEKLCERYPDLKKLPILPLADKCTECEEYGTCPVTRIIHVGKTCDGVAVTYSKLVALMLASGTRKNTTAEEVLNTLSRMHNTIFDEIHEVQYGRTNPLVIYRYSEKIGEWFNVEKYVPAMDEFEHLRKLVAGFSMLKEEDSVENAVMIVYSDTFDENYFKHKLSRWVRNTYYDENTTDAKFIMSVYSEIIRLTMERKKYNLSVGDILQLYTIMNIMMSEHVVIHGTRDRGVVKIMLTAVDHVYSSMLKSYVMSIQNKTKRTLLTSATICSHDYDQYFLGETGPKNITFGTGGDPMNTNSKMMIIADTKRYHAVGRNSRWNRKEEILKKITTILDLYGDDDCIVITLSIAEALELQKDLAAFGHPHDVTYYKAPEMMGVSADARVMIAVGVADKPTNTFDAITETKQESLILREESVHCDTWQAWSRVKDPNGKIPSLVFALGCTVEQCENIVTWGYNRTVEIQPYTIRQKKKVKINLEKSNLTKPIVIKAKDFKHALTVAEKHKQYKYLVSEIESNLLILNIIRSFEYITDTIYKKSDIIKLLINRDDVYAEQAANGSYFKVNAKISDVLLQNHIGGKITIGTYTLNNANEVKWICFDIDAHPKNDEDAVAEYQNADINKDRLCNFLERVGIPYILEASGSPHSYHVWILLKPVKASIAKSFGKEIIKAADVDCELFPKQCTIKRTGYGNLVKLPFAVNRKTGNRSKIFVDGEFRDDFESLQIGIVDISGFEAGTEKTRPTQTKTCTQKTRIAGVRPCIEEALEKNLESEQGHWMRIAIVREYYNFGMKNPEELAKLFSHQADYDFEKSLYHVNSIISDDYGIWRRETLIEKCGKFLNCEQCDRKDCRGDE